MVTGTAGLDGVCARAMELIAPSNRAIQIAVFIVALSSMKCVKWSSILLLNDGTKGNRRLGRRVRFYNAFQDYGQAGSDPTCQIYRVDRELTTHSSSL